MSFKNVAVQGATGNLGPYIVHALVDAGFNVTALSRSPSRPSSLPSSVSLAQVDLSSTESITSALKGQDALVSVVGNSGFAQQSSLIDAAIAAGVKFFLPSEFGSATDNPKTAALPVFAAKIQTQKYLQEEKKGKIGYAFVNNGAFLDWGLEKDFIINTSGGKSRVYDGGDVKFSATTLADVGKAVAGVLKSPDEWNGKFVHIKSADVTQNQLLKWAEKAGYKAETEAVSTDEVYKQSLETLQSGKGDIGAAFVGFLFSALFKPEYGNLYDPADSKKLGLKLLDDKEVEDLVAKVLNEKKK